MCDPYLSTGISFTPKEVGEHVVSVRKSGKHVTNSPFKILVGPSEIGDASKVRVWGKGLSEGQTFQVAEFIVDTRNAGASCPQRPLVSAGASAEGLSSPARPPWPPLPPELPGQRLLGFLPWDPRGGKWMSSCRFCHVEEKAQLSRVCLLLAYWKPRRPYHRESSRLPVPGPLGQCLARASSQ